MKAAITAWWLATMLPATALAHPGHGAAPSDQLAHYLDEPTHMALAMVASAFVVGLVWTVLSRAQRRS